MKLEAGAGAGAYGWLLCELQRQGHKVLGYVVPGNWVLDSQILTTRA